MLEDRDGRHVGQALGQRDIFLVQESEFRSKEVERSDRSTPKSHGKGVHGMEAVRDRPRSKDWPLIIGISEVPVHDGRAVAEAVDARTLEIGRASCRK